MGKIDKFCEELQKMSDQCIPYAGEGYGGIGCSEYIKRGLRNAGIISSTETFWAAQGNRGVLTDKSRFMYIAWSPKHLQKGDVLWSHGVHTMAWDGRGGCWEGSPRASHGVCDNGVTGVGHRTGHGYYNCGNNSYEWSNIYRIIDVEAVKDDIKKEVTMNKTENVKTIIEFMPTIKYGSNGSMVRALQTIMKKYGWYSDYIDGNAGPNTIAGIKLLQTALGVYVDGIVGPVTWTALLV